MRRTTADELFFDQIREEAVADESLRQAATANTMDNFRFMFEKALEGLFIDRVEQNEDLSARYMNDAVFSGSSKSTCCAMCTLASARTPRRIPQREGIATDKGHLQVRQGGRHSRQMGSK